MRRLFVFVLTALAIAGCTQAPPSQQEMASKRMEPVAGKAVVFIVQNAIGTYSAGLLLDEGERIVTWPATYYRWETTPGAHAIRSSEGNLSARIKLQLESGKVYFVQHSVTGLRGSTTDANLQLIKEDLGRRLVAGAELCCK
jgi:hypothetical protein